MQWRVSSDTTIDHRGFKSLLDYNGSKEVINNPINQLSNNFNSFMNDAFEYVKHNGITEEGQYEYMNKVSG